MKYRPIAIIFARWVFWLLLVSFESVVGFPWLSMLVAGEWIFRSAPQLVSASVVIMSLTLAAAYALSWPIAMLLMIIVWQTTVQTRKNSWRRWALYAASALAVGFIRQIPLTATSVFFTLVSTFIFLRLAGFSFVKKLWPKTLRTLPE